LGTALCAVSTDSGPQLNRHIRGRVALRSDNEAVPSGPDRDCTARDPLGNPVMTGAEWARPQSIFSINFS
ncbi:MAG: hypothetical protein L7T24_10410, partial [Luminiphilus sp.]|nr:hypothetical protein [Luminiphilus sp.]